MRAMNIENKDIISDIQKDNIKKLTDIVNNIRTNYDSLLSKLDMMIEQINDNAVNVMDNNETVEECINRTDIIEGDLSHLQ